MTSKSLFWKHSLWDIGRRSWILYLSITVWFFALPFFSYIGISSLLEDYPTALSNPAQMELLREEVAFTYFSSPFYLAISIVLGVIFAIQAMSWMNKRQKVDMYKSSPVKEITRFVYININSILIFTIPMIVGYIVSLIISAVYGVFVPELIKICLYSTIIFILTFYATYMLSVLSVLLTGNMVLAFFGSLFLLFVEPAIRLSIWFYQSEFFRTINYGSVSKSVLAKNVTSPVFSGINAYLSYRNGTLSELYNSTICYRAGLGLVTNNLFYLFVLVVQGVAYTLIAYYLYKKRPAQTGGKAVVFKQIIPLLKVVILFTIALGVGVFITSVGIGSDKEVSYGLAGIILSSIAVHILLNAIFEGDMISGLKGLIKTLPLSAFACGMVCVIFFSIAFDWFHFDTYLPNENQLESFYFSRTNDYSSYYRTDLLYDVDGNICTGAISNQDAKRILLETLRDAMERNQFNDYSTFDDERYVTSEKSARETLGVDSDLIYEDGNESESITIGFNLKNGKLVYRRYVLTKTDVRKIYSAIFETKEYKAVYNPLNSEKLEEIIHNDKIDKVVEYTSYCFEDLTHKKSYRDFTQEDIDELMDALKEDINEREYVDIIDLAPIGMITSYDSSRNTGYSASEYYVDNSEYLYGTSIYPCDSRTVAVLTKLGMNCDRTIPMDQIKEINVYQNCYYVNEETGEKEEEQKVLSLMPDSELGKKVIEDAFPTNAYYNSNDCEMLSKKNYFLRVITKDGKELSYELYTRDFPEELIEAMKNAKVNESWEANGY